MPTREELQQYRRVVVMGLGLFGGGAGAARYFAGLGAEVIVTDMASAEKLAPSVAALKETFPDIRFVLGEHHEDDFAAADLVVANQAVRPENAFLAIARKHGADIVTETGLALALNPSPWVGVTGSAGKSTTTSLLHAIVSQHDSQALLGGNIGGDLLTRVENRPAASPVIVELSSYQLTYVGEDLAAGLVKPPHVAVVTNITPNHLDWHADMNEYVLAKQSLLVRQSPRDWAVLHYDDATLAGWKDRTPARIVWTSRDDSGESDACFLREKTVVLRLNGEETLRVSLADFALLGGHNCLNALQSVAAGWIMTGGDRDAVAAGLRSFPGLPHRLEVVARVGGRVFVNDSKSTTPESCITALRAVDLPKLLIAGGYDKKSPFAELGREIQHRAVGLVLVGESAARLREAVLAAAAERPPGMGGLPIVDAGDDFEKAVTQACRLAPEGGCILLSPACASWGMFTNYEERGTVFAALAKGAGTACWQS